MEYRVPRLLWENLESVLLAQSKRYIGELAKRLNVPEKELQKRVLPTTESLKVLILDSHADSNQCQAYLQNDKLTLYCRKPVVYGSEFCAFHRSKRMTIISGTNPIQLQRLRDIPTLPPLWVNLSTVYNSKGDIVGKLNRKKNTVKLFITQS
jgi:hypothetical protein